MGLGPYGPGPIWAWAHGPRPMGQGPWAWAHGPGPMGPGPKPDYRQFRPTNFQKMDLFFVEIPINTDFYENKKDAQRHYEPVAPSGASRALICVRNRRKPFLTKHPLWGGDGDDDGGDGGGGGGRTPRQDPAPNPITHRDSISRSGSPLTPITSDLNTELIMGNLKYNICKSRVRSNQPLQVGFIIATPLLIRTYG